MKNVNPKPVVGLREFKNPVQVSLIEDDESDFTSCRLNDLPTDFAWGLATAAY